MPNLFNHNLIKTHIQKHQIDSYDEKLKVIQGWKKSLQTVKGFNEKALQSAFLQGIFAKALGYKCFGEADEWNLNIEVSTEVDSTTPDGILGFYTAEDSSTQVVIELKSPKHSLDKKQQRAGKDYGTPVEQAFSYVSKYDRCSWVIVSNMNEIRLYKQGRSQEYYESFFIDDLDQEEEFKKFHLLLCKENLIQKDGYSETYKLSERTKERIQDISVSFYNLYKDIRIRLFEELKKSNPDYSQESLVEKAQKFLDRIIFICFCEDLGLLPNDLLHQAIQRGKNSFSDSEYVIWEEIKGVFRAIEKGSEKHNIPAYDGGLFAFDEVLDNLSIRNDFFDTVYDISAYDFGTDLDVNILGHIFEQSIADIEELKSDVQKEEFDPQKSRRKKEGIYYTPNYITKYIVENSLGKYLEDIRKELGEDDLPDIETATNVQTEGRYRKKIQKFYQDYEERVKQVKVLDPACGSGAFLNQAFDFLLAEYKWIHDKISELFEGQTTIFDSDTYQRSVLQDNLYGVDINEESVEITKLSLWLKTADSRKALPYLDDNIKCGNSLIDDPEVAGDKAFDWNKEFPEIMESGGFDVVIGNPPWGADFNREELGYLRNNYSSVIVRMVDSYLFFIDLAMRLTKKGLPIGFIIPSTILNQSDALAVRNNLLNRGLSVVVNLGGFVFSSEVYNTSTIFISKTNSQDENIIILDIKDAPIQQKPNVLKDQEKTAMVEWEKWRQFVLKSNNLTFYVNNIEATVLLNWLKDNHIKFKDALLENIQRGVTPDLVEQFVVNKEKAEAFELENDLLYPSISGSQIKRYNGNWNIDQFIIYTTKQTPIEKYPNTLSYMIQYKDKINCQEVKLGKHPWWALHRSRDLNIFRSPKFIGITTSKFIEVIYDIDSDVCVTDAMYVFKIRDYINPWYVMAVIQSKLFLFLYRIENQGESRVIPQIKATKIEPLPFPDYYPDNKKCSKIEELVKEIYCFKRRLEEILLNSKPNKTIEMFTSEHGKFLKEITDENSFINYIYSGRANKIKKLSLTNYNTIISLHNSNNTRQELLKFEVKDHYKRQYLKLYLENLTEEQLAEINQYEGNILDKVMQIKIPDYDKPHVIKRVVDEWNQLQKEKAELEEKIERTDKEIDQMVYELYGLTDEEIKIVEENV